MLRKFPIVALIRCCNPTQLNGPSWYAFLTDDLSSSSIVFVYDLLLFKNNMQNLISTSLSACKVT